MMPIEKELEEVLDAVAPPLLDLDELHRLVAIDEDPATFNGECDIHDSCQSVNRPR